MHVIAYSVKPDDLVFDVGANLGDKTAWFADRGARVVAVEPQPRLAAHLLTRFKSNARVAVVATGLGANYGLLEMSLCENETLGTFSDDWKRGRFQGQTWLGRVNIGITTLDTLIDRFGVPAFTKIDVEGFETEVIAGLSGKAGILSFEFTSEYLHKSRRICERLEAIGYTEFNLSLAEADNFSDANWRSYSQILQEVDRMRSEWSDVWGDIYAR